MPKDNPRIYLLVKVFQEEQHARDFMDGKLFANRLSYFKRIDGSDIRKDEDEDEGAVLLPRDGAVLDLTAKNPVTGEVISSIRITGSDLAAPIIMRPGWANHVNLFCMYAVHHSCDSEDIAGSKKQLTVPKGVLEGFGKHAVVIENIREFFRRVVDGAKQQGYAVKGRLVTYYDAEIGTPPELSYEDAVFAKRNEFRHEQEFRIVINSGTAGNKAIPFYIGSISDIATYIGLS